MIYWIIRIQFNSFIIANNYLIILLQIMSKFICEKCNFVGKNLLALSVHKRSCDKTNLPTEEVDCVSPINIKLSPSVQPVVLPKQGKTNTKKGGR